MGKNNVLEVYDANYAQEYNHKFLLNDFSKENANFEQETIRKLLGEFGESAKWLDVACGTGYFLSRFPNIERAGLDISPGMLNVAKQANPNALFVQGDYRDKRPQWEGKWDLVSCMWWAYCYVESLSELETVVENLADWTSEQGVCFLPICIPEGLGTGELKMPYICPNVGGNGGNVQFEGVIWSWIDEEAGKQHLNMFAPQVEYLLALFKKHFELVEIIEYPLFKGGIRKAVVARNKKQKLTPKSKKVEEKHLKIELLSSFFKIIRASEWWLYKIAPLTAIAYAEIFLIKIPPLKSITTVLTCLLSIFSVGAYGYLINDIFDIEVDRKAAKSNAMAQFQPWQRFLFCLLFIATGFAVPILMKFGMLAIILLAINYLLPTLYSVPPLRLKERGIWGILSDAAGVHLIPTLFVATTFLHLSASPQTNAITFSVVAAIWAFFAGVRGILLHQLWDRDNDLNAGISTFATQLQPELVRSYINRLVFPCEIIFFSSLAVFLSRFSPLLQVFFIVYALITLIKLNVTQTSLDPSPPEGKNIIPHDLYEVWFPLVLAILLATHNPVFIIFFSLTLILFYPSIKIRVMEIVNLFQVLFSHSNLGIEKTQEKKQLEVKLKNLQQQLALKTQQLEAQQREALQAKTEIDQYRKSLQNLQEQAQKQIDQLQTQAKEAATKLEYTQSELQTTQTELAQFKSYLLQTQGTEGLIGYYRYCIVCNPDDIQLYHQALAIKPDDEQIILQIGNALVRQNRFAEAIATYETALQSQPDNIDIHLALGKALEKAQKWDEAINAYKYAINLNPDYSWSHKHLGDILAERGHMNEASLCYHRALQLQPRIF
ncbi:tetratricopeptide repeat protein [Nostoc sp. FACHB-152]|uniref:tetratricopeptide repeat protein n=1 Tax=unclassified Nostoc TaxID=2593658 RepID=UPI001686F40B|nr:MULTISPECIES: tetratricopeptide repeat protein [unclassified Nostoc]MBD2451337.1 tetratricopeptide repeat protein [Nostoc sp. FACHB-152]MBD2466298.1 tetratricopeptide repeat protein [Nostoc sp. FACHB-145]